jgi:hypothetical protein
VSIRDVDDEAQPDQDDPDIEFLNHEDLDDEGTEQA